jgi:hypothetical protein
VVPGDTISIYELAEVLETPVSTLTTWQGRRYLKPGGRWDYPSAVAAGMFTRAMAHKPTGREASAKAVGMAKVVGELLDQAASDTSDQAWIEADRLLFFTARYPGGAVRSRLARSETEAKIVTEVLIETGAVSIEMIDATSVFRSVTEAFFKLAAKRRKVVPA